MTEVEPPSPPAQPRSGGPALTQRLLLAYGLPGLPIALLLLPLTVYLPVYYAEDLGLGLAVVGLVLLAARLWDLVTDPLIGLLSDHSPFATGRRRPWILLGTPLVILGAWFLLLPGGPVTWSGLLIWSIVLYTGLTLVVLPYLALGAELSPGYHERTRIAAYREAFVVVGTLVAVSLPLVAGEARGDALGLLFWILAAVLPVAALLLLMLVPEPRVTRPRPQPWRQSLRVLGENRPFRRLIIAYLLNGVAGGLPAGLFFLFVDHVLDAPDRAGLLLVVYFAAAVASLPLWLAASRRFEKHRSWIFAIAIACLAFIWVPLLDAGDVAWFLVICLITGVCLGADLVLPASMQADVVDLDRLRSGRQRAGLLFSLWAMATKLALALSIGIAFPLLDLAGFQEGASDQTETTLLALGLLYGLLPVVFKLAAAALVWRFPITLQHHERIRRQIAETDPDRQESAPAYGT